MSANDHRIRQTTIGKSVAAMTIAGALTLFLVSSAFGQLPTDEKAIGFRVLTIGGSPYAVGIAETMVAGADDPFVAEYNPAALTSVDRFMVSFAHNSFFLDTRGEYLATAVPMGRWAMGARMAYVGTSDIPRRVGPSENPLSYYDATDGIVQVSAAAPVDERLSVGISAGIVVEHIDIETAETVILGFGVLYHVRHNLQAGASFVNIGPPAKFVDEEFQTPDQLRLGARWLYSSLTARAELVAGEKENVKWQVAGEYEIDPRLTLRGGIKIGYDTQWFAAGFGARLPDGRFGVDYAFAPYTDDLGSTHRFGLTVRP
jgi:hypothetical protein